MINLFKNAKEKKTYVDTFKNPFNNESCTSISLYIKNDPFWTNGKTVYKATIEFKKGNTTGKHRIKADDFFSLLGMVEEFVGGL